MDTDESSAPMSIADVDGVRNVEIKMQRENWMSSHTSTSNSSEVSLDL